MEPLQTILERLPGQASDAVRWYWETRATQSRKPGKEDQGGRRDVTGGAHMDAFVSLLSQVVEAAGVPASCVHVKRAVELPGYFRPTKEWDLVVVRDDRLIAALEVKSQAGPSFGNNFNNRTEEAMGSALDLWTAFREGAFGISQTPFVGYLLFLEAAPAAVRPVRVEEHHFPVFPEFKGSSYLQRYQLFCRKLVLERHYSATAFLTSTQEGGRAGSYEEPADDLRLERFVRLLYAHVAAVGCE